MGLYKLEARFSVVLHAESAQEAREMAPAAAVWDWGDHYDQYLESSLPERITCRAEIPEGWENGIPYDFVLGKRGRYEAVAGDDRTVLQCLVDEFSPERLSNGRSPETRGQLPDSDSRLSEED